MKYQHIKTLRRKTAPTLDGGKLVNLSAQLMLIQQGIHPLLTEANELLKTCLELWRKTGFIYVPGHANGSFDKGSSFSHLRIFVARRYDHDPLLDGDYWIERRGGVYEIERQPIQDIYYTLCLERDGKMLLGIAGTDPHCIPYLPSEYVVFQELFERSLGRYIKKPRLQDNASPEVFLSCLKRIKLILESYLTSLQDIEEVQPSFVI